MIMVKNVCLINRESDMYRCKFAQHKNVKIRKSFYSIEV